MDLEHRTITTAKGTSIEVPFITPDYDLAPYMVSDYLTSNKYLSVAGPGGPDADIKAKRRYPVKLEHNGHSVWSPVPLEAGNDAFMGAHHIWRYSNNNGLTYIPDMRWAANFLEGHGLGPIHFLGLQWLWCRENHWIIPSTIGDYQPRFSSDLSGAVAYSEISGGIVYLYAPKDYGDVLWDEMHRIRTKLVPAFVDDNITRLSAWFAQWDGRTPRNFSTGRKPFRFSLHDTLQLLRPHFSEVFGEEIFSNEKAMNFLGLQRRLGNPLPWADIRDALIEALKGPWKGGTTPTNGFSLLNKYAEQRLLYVSTDWIRNHAKLKTNPTQLATLLHTGENPNSDGANISGGLEYARYTAFTPYHSDRWKALLKKQERVRLYETLGSLWGVQANKFGFLPD